MNWNGFKGRVKRLFRSFMSPLKFLLIYAALWWLSRKKVKHGP